MLLSHDPDMLNTSEDYIKSYIHFYNTKFLINRQLIVTSKINILLSIYFKCGTLNNKPG